MIVALSEIKDNIRISLREAIEDIGTKTDFPTAGELKKIINDDDIVIEKEARFPMNWSAKSGRKPPFVYRGRLTEPRLCVCNFPDRNAMTMLEWEVADGHFNQAGGYCCPHHGNTCGHCQHFSKSK
jgi:hypothetical protein